MNSAERKRPRTAPEDALVPGLLGAIAAALVASGQPAAEAWQAVVGPSRIIALSLLIAFTAWLVAACRRAAPASLAAGPLGLALGVVSPVELWAIALVAWGLLSAARRSATAPALLALGAVGLHVALLAGRLPSLLSMALTVDVATVAALVELSGRAVTVSDTVLLVEDGMSLRLISQCSSLWPVLTVAGALGAGLGSVGLGSARGSYVVLAAAVAAVACVNLLRLAAMGTSAETYHWLHDGGGTVVVRTLILATIVVAFAVAVLRRPALPVLR